MLRVTEKPADDAYGPEPTAGEAASGAPSARFGALPIPLRVGLATVLLETVVFLLLGVAELASLSTDRLVMGITTAVFFLGYGVLIGLCARGMARRRTWGRSIVVMGQLIQLGVAWNFWGGETKLVSVVLALVAAVVLVAVFHPASTRALVDDPTGSRDQE